MTFRSLETVVLAVLGLGAAGCVSDAAVRLAYCVEDAAQEMVSSGAEDLRHYCELGVGTGSRVVAFPSRVVRSDELRALGLTDDDLRALSRLEMDDRWIEKIKVLPADPRTRSSRTGYHGHFVDTPEPLVCEIEGTGATVVLHREGGRVVWVALESGLSR